MGAVAKKAYVPELTHVVIEEGKVRGYNGTIALCSPIPFNIECKPKAEPLVKAIGQCDSTILLAMTPAGRLSVKSGAYKSFIDCVDGETPHVLPEGELVQVDGEVLYNAVKALHVFIGNDASRPWTNGILLRGSSAFATNNVIVAEYWLGVQLPFTVNIPITAVKEMLRINEAPVALQLAENSVTMHYSGDRWLRSQLYSTEWPDIGKVLSAPTNPTELDTRIFEAIDSISSFVDKNGRIYMNPGVIGTSLDREIGAHYELEGFSSTGIYHVDMISKLQGVATHIDWTTYPRPCLFFGDRLRGAIVGLKS